MRVIRNSCVEVDIKPAALTGSAAECETLPGSQKAEKNRESQEISCENQLAYSMILLVINESS
jgi:hypothetical protein